jgi:hypothetical protein
MGVSGHIIAMNIGGAKVTKAYFNGQLVFGPDSSATSVNNLCFSSSSKFTVQANFNSVNAMPYGMEDPSGSMSSDSSMATSSKLEYSTDNSTWTECMTDSITAVKDTSDKKYKVYFRGTGGEVVGRTFVYTGNSDCTVSGSVLSLLDYKTVDSGDEPELGAECFEALFSGMDKLVSADFELPSLVVPEKGYYNMFTGCTALETPPKISAEEVGASGMKDMFYNCSAMTEAQDELYIKTIDESGCEEMYANCSGLTKLPTLVNQMKLTGASALQNMFNGCSVADNGDALYVSLKTTSENGCYGMFAHCGLTCGANITCTGAVAKSCFMNMYQYCTSMTDGGSITLGKQSCGEQAFSYMYYNCTALNTLPTFTGYKLGTAANQCDGMFGNCSGLYQIWTFASFGAGITSLVSTSVDSMFVHSALTFYTSNNGTSQVYQFATSASGVYSSVNLTPFFKVSSATQQIYIPKSFTIITLNG